MITFDWYRGFIQLLADNHAEGWFARLIVFGELAVALGLILGTFTGAAAAGGFGAAAVPQGCGPHGAGVRSLTSWDATNGRNFAAKPSTKSWLEYTDAQCARRSASSSNFQRWMS